MKNMGRFFEKVVIIFGVIVLYGAATAFAGHVFEPWEDEVFVAVGKEHGPEAEKRIRKIMDVIIANHDKPPILTFGNVKIIGQPPLKP
jgi:hypothetical protein